MDTLLIGVVLLIILLRELHVAYDVSRQRKTYIQKHHLQNIYPSLLYRTLKRLCDIIVSLIGCILILPLLYIILGLIIKLTSKGPIIFKQKRYGLFGTEFICYKFRSMYQNVSAEKVSNKTDVRITPIGRFMRKSHLDELPQFFNILKGDMSLVGPRPLPFKEIKKFNKTKEAYSRLLLRPGITGLTQIHSGRQLSTEKYLQYDNLYVLNPSLIKDISILWQTLKFSDVSF